MPKRALDIGNCGPDNSTITQIVTGHFDAVVDKAHRGDDALSQLSERAYDLVKVNRLLDIHGSYGM